MNPDNPIVGILELSKRDLDMIKGGQSEVVLGAEHTDLIGLFTEASLNGLLDTMKNEAERAIVLNWKGGKIPRGVQINGKVIEWTQNGVVNSADGNIIGTYDRLMEFGGADRNEQCMVVFPLDNES